MAPTATSTVASTPSVATTAKPAPATSPKPATAAETDKPVYGGTFLLSFRDDPPSLDVHQESTITTLTGVGNTAYNGLLTWDYLDHNKIGPDLAKRWEISQDGLTAIM